MVGPLRGVYNASVSATNFVDFTRHPQGALMDQRRAPGDAAPSSASRLHQLTNRLRGHRVVHKLWAMLDDARTTARGVAQEHLPEVTALGRRLAERMLAEPSSGRHPVVNASGVVLPDWVDLPMPVAAIEKMAQQACAMTTGQDGPEGAGRDLHAVRHLIRQLSGADSALVLHNEAAALTAVFAGLAAGGEVVAARGQVGCIDRNGLVLLTDVITAGGARLHEVGSVEHVSAEDYQRATGKPAALVLHATPTHYAVAGVASSTALDEIIEVSHRAGLPIVDFLPAALLAEMTGFGWSGPVVSQSLIAGADIVVFNGYRYLGGPPCGIVAGRYDLIQRIAVHPLARMLAADRLTVTALEATLELTRDRSAAERAIPLWQLLMATPDALRNRAQRLAPRWRIAPKWHGQKSWIPWHMWGPASYPRNNCATGVLRWNRRAARRSNSPRCYEAELPACGPPSSMAGL